MPTGGQTFPETVAAVDIADARAFDPCLWTDPFGGLWWIYNVMPEYAAYACVCDGPDGLALDTRDNVSYPDAAQDVDGTIYIVYDRERGAYCKSLEECTVSFAKSISRGLPRTCASTCLRLPR